MQRVGPYSLLEVIGRGGSGVVFRALHLANGEVVALKMLLAESVRDIGSMRREIDTLRRLNHPGVVRIIEQGVDAGVPWYAMELLEGETLSSYARRIWRERSSPPTDIRTAPTEPSTRPGEPRSRAGSAGGAAPMPVRRDLARPLVACGELPFVLRVARRLCDTLGFIHGEGIVHRDLKSANVLACSGAVPKLLDFGLAWRFPGAMGREVLGDVSAGAAGTAGYMAPEQIRGEIVDARADLYSLGCVLYELLTGQAPFGGRSAAEVRRSHLEAPVLPPSVLVTGVPPELDDLVLALLSKRASDRPGHAAEVARMLSSVARDEARWEGQLLPRSYVYRSAIVGRAEPLEVIASHVDGALQGRGSLVCVCGESGVGKTYLAMAAARAAAERGAAVITSTCLPLGASGREHNDTRLQAFRSVLLAIADRCVASPDLVPALLGARGKILAACEPHLVTVPTVASHPDPEPLPARAAHERLLVALEETLVAFAAVCPFVLIIDDLQWSDDLSLRFLTSLPSGWFSDKGLMIACLYRADEETDAIRRLLRRSDVGTLALGRLSEVSLGELVRGMLALDHGSEDLLEPFVRHAEGNPFFAAEYLRAAVGERLLYRGRSGSWQVHERLLAADAGKLTLPLPTSIAALIERRLDALSDTAQNLLAAAAVLGGELDPELVFRVAGLSEEAAWEPTRELMTRQIWEEVEGVPIGASRARFRFLHQKLREAAYRRVPAGERGVLHRRAALVLEERYVGSPELPLLRAALAHHHLQAGAFMRAIEHLEHAGDEALATYSNADALRHFESAVEIDLRAAVGVGPAGSGPHAWDAELAAPVDGGGAEMIRRANLRRARWERKIAEAHYALGDLQAVERHIVRALHLLGCPPPRTPLGWKISFLAELSRRVSRWASAGRPAYEVDALERDILIEAATATHHLAERRYYSFEALPMITASLRAVNLGEHAGVAVRLATPYAMLGMAAGISQLPALGRRYFERARRAAIRTADEAGMAYSLYAKAAWRIGEGAWEEVHALCNECLAIARRTHNGKALGMAQTLMGHAAFYTGRFADSVLIYRELEERARASGDLQHLSWGLYAGARARICLGELDRAREMLIESNALLEPLVEVPSKIIAPGLLAAVHLRSGDVQSALAAAELTTGRIRKNLPTVFATVAGYAGVAEVYLARWEELSREGRDAAETRAARRLAQRAVFDLLTLAINIPLGWPYYHRVRGEALRIEGKRRRAEAAFRRSLRSARKLRMPHDEALAHLGLARVGLPGSALRIRHAGLADAMLEGLGCRLERARASRLLSGAAE